MLFHCKLGQPETNSNNQKKVGAAGKPNPSGLCHLRLKTVISANAVATRIHNLHSNAPAAGGGFLE